MQPIFAWIDQHHATAALAGYWVFSALVSGMPAPSANAGVGYVWLYQSLHFVASNLNSVFAKKAGQAQQDLLPHVTPQPATVSEVQPNPPEKL